MKRALAYDDVNIIPKYSELGSRSEIDLKTNFTKKTKLTIPVVSTPCSCSKLICLESKSSPTIATIVTGVK